MTKILVIEDEKHIRESIIDTLEFDGYEVYDYPNGLAGVEAAIDIKPDLILCDVMMPDLDGYGVLLELSQHPETARIPFIFLTARVTKEDIRKGMSMGADDYLTKPFTAPDLLEAVKSRLERHARLEQYNLQQMEYMRQYINLTLPHELRTPLTGALGYMEMAKYGIEDGNMDMAVTMLNKSGKALNRLAGLVENFVAYSQLRLLYNDPDILERIKEHSHLKNFHELAKQTAEEVAFKFGRLDDISIQLEPANIHMFYDHGKKLLSAILDNAFKFSTDNFTVIVNGQIIDNTYILSVTNNGRGMTIEQIASIGLNKQFERERYEQQGAGLGLVIIQQILAMYDGDLHIESILGEETTVTLRLQLSE